MKNKNETEFTDCFILSRNFMENFINGTSDMSYNEDLID